MVTFSPSPPFFQGFIFGQVINIALLINILFKFFKFLVVLGGLGGGWVGLTHASNCLDSLRSCALTVYFKWPN
jgi:hypothetical protein